jgi:uncharacterized protein (DUF433 family)
VNAENILPGDAGCSNQESWVSLGVITSWLNGNIMTYKDIITIDPDKRGGKPCIRGLRITVYDVLGWLANGMTSAEIIEDFPELTHADIMACLAFAADRERAVTWIKAA